MDATPVALEGLVALKGAVLNRDEVLDRDELKLSHERSLEWTPEEAEHYIDRRIQLLDLEIARVRGRLDDLISARKRWLAVTGGRSKMFANGNGPAGSNGA